MQSLKQGLAIVACAVSLAGCASAGNEARPDQAINFQTGVTTENEIVEALGRPTYSWSMPGGAEAIVYTFAQIQARPAAFLPFTGPVLSNSDYRTNQAMFLFDADRRLVSYAATQGEFRQREGFSASGVMNAVKMLGN